MLTKIQKTLRNRYLKGSLNIHAAARRLGYKGGSMSKGMRHIREILRDMHITVA